MRDKAPFRIAGNEDYAVLGDVVTGYGQKVIGLPEAKTSGLVMCGGRRRRRLVLVSRPCCACRMGGTVESTESEMNCRRGLYVVDYAITPALLGDPQSKERPTQEN